MANTVEVVSTGQVLVTQVTEQAIEVQAPGSPLVVEVATAGPQGPNGGVSTLAELSDVDTTQRVDKSVLYYDGDLSIWKGDDINTVITITDGGNW